MSKPNIQPRASTGQRKSTGPRSSLPPKPTHAAPTPDPPPPPATPPPAKTPSESMAWLRTAISSGPSQHRSLVDVRRKHIGWVYAIHTVLSALAVVQLVTLRLCNQDFSELISPSVPSFVWLLLALGCVLIMGFVYVASQCPCNGLLAIVVVEVMVIFVNCHRWARLSMSWMAGVLAIVLVLNVLLYMMGIYLPLKLLPGTIFILVLTLCCIVIVVSIYLIVYLNGNRYMMRYVSMVSLIYVATLVLFTIPVIHQRRFEQADRTEFVLQATVLAMLFVYMIHPLSTMVRFGQFLVDHL
ncbi:uncharacterized protein LOC6551969 [Drosophila erecta]|uniref:GG17650 n=1 Tax=Drosophila erecta TaxID=7220 RepID=B3P1L3_DROER|nr:uncharacterized protein LOC6551969 [Drosophila erecta]EDV49612.1 uncharacterized protein Dere_GG17650 [Drosophila erecta]